MAGADYIVFNGVNNEEVEINGINYDQVFFNGVEVYIKEQVTWTSIQLKPSSIDDCSGTFATYYINDIVYADATLLSADPSGSPLANLNWYSDGTITRQWNGTIFKSSRDCSGTNAITVTPDTVSIPQPGGNDSVTVDSTGAWTITQTSGTTNYFKITPTGGTGPSGQTTVTFAKVGANTLGSPIVCTYDITIDGTSVKASVTVTHQS